MLASRNLRSSVIPAEAGIQPFKGIEILWTPVFTGEKTFCGDIINIGEKLEC